MWRQRKTRSERTALSAPSVFNYAYDEPELGEALRQELAPLGLFVEQCTSWFSAVYAV